MSTSNEDTREQHKSRNIFGLLIILLLIIIFLLGMGIIARAVYQRFVSNPVVEKMEDQVSDEQSTADGSQDPDFGLTTIQGVPLSYEQKILEPLDISVSVPPEANITAQEDSVLVDTDVAKLEFWTGSYTTEFDEAVPAIIANRVTIPNSDLKVTQNSGMSQIPGYTAIVIDDPTLRYYVIPHPTLSKYAFVSMRLSPKEQLEEAEDILISLLFINPESPTL